MQIDDKIMKAMDKNVGKHIRLKRLELGMTQGKLANEIGLSYQQIQKYETGSNRVSSGRLFFIAQILETPVFLFYQDIPKEVRDHLSDRAKRRDSLQDLSGIPVPVKQALSGLITSLRAH